MYGFDEKELTYEDYDIPYDGRKRPTKFVGDEIEDDEDEDRRGVH